MPKNAVAQLIADDVGYESRPVAYSPPSRSAFRFGILSHGIHRAPNPSTPISTTCFAMGAFGESAYALPPHNATAATAANRDIF